MTDDRAMKCAEEICERVGACRTYAPAVANMIHKHYPSSWTRIEKDKAETLPPKNDTVTVFVECGDKRYTMRNVLWNGYQWETCNEDGRWYLAEYSMTVTHWMDEPLPAAPEEK